MDPQDERALLMTRRHFFSRTSTGIGAAVLATLLDENLRGDEAGASQTGGLPGLPHFPPRPSVSSICFKAARPRSWNSSITSRGLKNCVAANCPTRSARGSGSLA